MVGGAAAGGRAATHGLEGDSFHQADTGLLALEDVVAPAVVMVVGAAADIVVLPQSVDRPDQSVPGDAVDDLRGAEKVAGAGDTARHHQTVDHPGLWVRAAAEVDNPDSRRGDRISQVDSCPACRFRRRHLVGRAGDYADRAARMVVDCP